MFCIESIEINGYVGLFRSIAEPCLRQSLSGLSQASVRARIVPFSFVRQKNTWHRCRVFSRYFSYPCRHPYTIATYLHYDHRRRHIISCFCSVFNWNICLCHCQKYQWMFRSVRGVSSYPECSGFVSEFEHLYVVTWSDSKLVHNYTGLNFHWNYSHSAVCSIKNRLVLFRETGAVCCGNCRKQLSEAFVAICGLMLKCVAHTF